MMKKNRCLFLNNCIHISLGIVFLVIACIRLLALPPQNSNKKNNRNDEKISITIIQLNDVYEIAGVDIVVLANYILTGNEKGFSFLGPEPIQFEIQ